MSSSAEASTSAPTSAGGERTLRLHVWGSQATLPTLDPTSLYAAALLHATFAHSDQVRVEIASATTALARVPLLQVLDAHAETAQLIDSVAEIHAFCTAAGLDAAVAADPEKAARMTAMHALLDDQLLDLTLHSLFSLPSNYRAVTAPAYSAVGGLQQPASSNPLAKLARLPAAFQPSIPARLRNVVEARLTAVGLWGLGGSEAAMQSSESDQLAARAGIIPTKKRGLGASAKQATRDEFDRSKLVTRARDVLDVVAAALPSSPGRFMFDAAQPTSIDAHVFAYLAPLVFAQPKLPIDALPNLVQSYTDLAAYLDTVREALLPAQTAYASPDQVQTTPPALPGAQSDSLLSYFWPFPAPASSTKASLDPPPSGAARTHARPPASSSTPRPPKPTGASSASPEDRRLRWGRALWICSALVGFVGYAFASGIVSVQWVDADDSDDDDDEDDEDEDEDEGDEEDAEEGEEDDGNDKEEEGWQVQGEEDLDDDEMDELDAEGDEDDDDE